MRQWFSFQEHSKRGNAASHPVCRAATLDVRGFAFRAAGRQPIDLGWRAAFPDWQPAAETGDDAQLLPALRNGEIAQLENPTIEDKETRPPPRYNEPKSGSWVIAVRAESAEQ